MDPIFTQYVRSLEPGLEPDAESFSTLWGTLRGALVTEMRKRSLWNVSPSFLGIHGHESWSQAAAFDELMSDCYTFIFLDRLPALQAQLKVKDNVEGLVFRNIRNFLYEAQKKNDPIGFRTYSMLSQAVRELIDAGTLHIVEGGSRLHRGTILGWTAEETEVFHGGFEAETQLWCDELLPELVTERGSRKDAMVKQLAERIQGLSDCCRSGQVVLAFPFGDLVSALRCAVRVRWDRFWSFLEGDTAVETVDGEKMTHVAIALPEFGVEERDAFDKLCLHMEEAVEGHEGSPKVKEDLRRFWGHLRRLASGSGPEKIPSRRELCRVLGISRHQLAAFLALMGQWVRRYQTVVGSG